LSIINRRFNVKKILFVALLVLAGCSKAEEPKEPEAVKVSKKKEKKDLPPVSFGQTEPEGATSNPAPIRAINGNSADAYNAVHGTQNVSGYTKKDGTVVAPYKRK
jgi:hypothetical protein